MDDVVAAVDELGTEVAIDGRGVARSRSHLRSATLEPVDSTTDLAHPDPDLEFDCPRCGAAVAEGFYGPCAQCRTVLRATVGREARAVATSDYEPKMNVTPNAVATKD